MEDEVEAELDETIKRVDRVKKREAKKQRERDAK
jgi:hypothetical protein